MRETVLEISNLSKSFGGLRALQGVDFAVESNSITGLIGPNGCGKSTTFNAITGIIPPDTGSVKVFGQETIGYKPYEINQMGLSRTFQNTRLWRELTVIENLLLPPKQQKGTKLLHALNPLKLYRKQEKELISKAYEILNLLEIEHMANNYASELSGGQSKLVDIGRLLMSDPKILLLDEPVAGVAGPLTEKIFQNLKVLRDELDISVLLIEHNMEFVLRKGVDRVVVMAAGKVIASGTPNDIRAKQEVIEAYLGE